jgi:hypothetical protein
VFPLKSLFVVLGRLAGRIHAKGIRQVDYSQTGKTSVLEEHVVRDHNLLVLLRMLKGPVWMIVHMGFRELQYDAVVDQEARFGLRLFA